jgi:hypothetical protein
MRKIRLTLLALAFVTAAVAMPKPSQATITCEILCWTQGNDICWQSGNCKTTCCDPSTNRFCSSPCD